MNLDDLKKYDSFGMYKTYDIWPELSKKSYELDYDPVDFQDIDDIIFSGMGGSGAIGDLLQAIFSKTNIHVTVVKGYILPKTVNPNTLVIAISMSGNTAETLSILEMAINKTNKIVAFSDGGKIKEFCNQNKVLHKDVQMIHSPRASLPMMIYPVLKILQNILPLKKTDIEDSITQMEKLHGKINSSNLTNENPSLSIANWIKGIPMIYYPMGLQPAAIRFKNSLQENAKSHVITEDIIEACHNGIVAWETKSSVQPILLQGPDDFIKTKERWKIIKEFFDKKNISYYDFHTIHGNILTKLMHTTYLFDFASIYLAVKNGINPTPIKPIEFIKSRL